VRGGDGGGGLREEGGSGGGGRVRGRRAGQGEEGGSGGGGRVWLPGGEGVDLFLWGCRRGEGGEARGDILGQDGVLKAIAIQLSAAIAGSEAPVRGGPGGGMGAALGAAPVLIGDGHPGHGGHV